MFITEIVGTGHTFTLADKTTLRVQAREINVPVPDDLVSEELRIAHNMGYIKLTSSDIKKPEVKTKRK